MAMQTLQAMPVEPPRQTNAISQTERRLDLAVQKVREMYGPNLATYFEKVQQKNLPADTRVSIDFKTVFERLAR